MSIHLQSRCLTFRVVQLKQCLTSGNNSRILIMTSGLSGDLFNSSFLPPLSSQKESQEKILPRLELRDKAAQTPSNSGANYNPDK